MCTKNQENFEWLNTTAKTFHADMVGKHPVLGGYDHMNNNGELAIGRLMHEGNFKIGEIASYNLDYSQIYFPFKNVEKHKGDGFEALVYTGPLLNLDVRGNDCASWDRK